MPPGGAATSPPSLRRRPDPSLDPAARRGSRPAPSDECPRPPGAGRQLRRAGSGTGPEQRFPAFWRRGTSRENGDRAATRAGPPRMEGQAGPRRPLARGCGWREGHRRQRAAEGTRGRVCSGLGGARSRPVRPGAAPTCGRGDAPPRKCAPRADGRRWPRPFPEATSARRLLGGHRGELPGRPFALALGTSSRPVTSWGGAAVSGGVYLAVPSQVCHLVPECTARESGPRSAHTGGSFRDLSTSRQREALGRKWSAPRTRWSPATQPPVTGGPALSTEF